MAPLYFLFKLSHWGASIMKINRIQLAAALLAGGLVAASATLPAGAADAPSDGTPATSGPHGWGGHGHHWGHRGPGMLFRNLDLTDTQKASFKTIMQQNKSALNSLHEQTHANSLKLLTTLPNDPNYASVVASISQANAGLLSQELTLQSNIHAQLYGLLSPAQQAQYAANIAKMQARIAEHAGKRSSAQ
jgi:Spy/CpxP family protein refolding chaperone